ncbi:MAG: hypothetical protein NTV52_05450 [Acidobacteria bacterium]|nr:hypothetical protein [Acidobacteriota bacterium]
MEQAFAPSSAVFTSAQAVPGLVEAGWQAWLAGAFAVAFLILGAGW